jgi:hypothetical protein
MSAGATLTKVRMSYEEYEKSVDASTHSEWVDGEVSCASSPTFDNWA